MLSEIQHFGITVKKPLETLRFYNGALKFPFVSLNMVKGRQYEKIYRLEQPVNLIAWYQFPDAGMELFHLPKHPPRNTDVGNILLPGYRYAGYRVEGLDEYMERLDARGIECRLAEHAGGRALLVHDPSGINVVLFEAEYAGDCARGLGLEEVGLTVADPDAYEEYFKVIGLAPAPGPDPAILETLFAPGQPMITRRFGHIRLLHFPESKPAATQKFFPYGGAEEAHRFNDSGIQHAAYVVDDAAEFFESARASGVYFLFEPTRVLGGSIISYFLDPEGNTIEIMQLAGSAAQLARIMGEIKLKEMAVRSRLRRLLHGK
jgi:catechol 2,3-dioxygenase-like lactoylglutathione lyase family enzyme